jgi:uncharacterized protein (DUF2249 family)
MSINANTKIATILKQRPEALEAIVGISSKFEKLRNPLLRKLIAGRTSIAMASKIGGCKVTDFFSTLAPLGFEIDAESAAPDESAREMPDFMLSLEKKDIVEMDVRNMIASGHDPLSSILDHITSLKKDQVLKIINSFYPQPLILLLEKQGFESFADVIDDDLVETYFYKKRNSGSVPVNDSTSNASADWDDVYNRFEGRMQSIDVRNLAMPLPMLTILQALDQLPRATALFVRHKRLPVFLLPELTDRQFSYRIQEFGEGDTRMLIYKE